MRRKIISFMLILSVLFFPVTGSAAEEAPLEISAKAYILMDANSKKPICGRNTDMPLPMASTTKIMTALIACESGRLDEVVTVRKSDIMVEGTSMGLQEGNQLSLKTLLYGLMLKSGNDAANVIASFLGGSKEEFVAMMNRRAQSLGLKSTHFMNPHGLDHSEHYTTAYELGVITAEALKNPDFAEVVSTQSKRLEYEDSSIRYFKNSNRLLRTYADCIGVKTGFTKKARRCLVSASSRDNKKLVCVTLNAPNDWDDHTKLLDYGQEFIDTVTLGEEIETLTVPVVGGTVDQVTVQPHGSKEISLLKEEIGKIKRVVEIPRFLYAPAGEGDKIGSVCYYFENMLLYRQDILLNTAIQNKSAPVKVPWWKKIIMFFQNLF